MSKRQIWESANSGNDKMSTSRFLAKTVLPAPMKVIFCFGVVWVIRSEGRWEGAFWVNDEVSGCGDSVDGVDTSGRSSMRSPRPIEAAAAPVSTISHLLSVPVAAGLLE